MMLQKPKSRKTAILKYGLSAPLFLIAMVLSSATISENKTIKQIENQIQPAQPIAEILVPKMVDSENLTFSIKQPITSTADSVQNKNGTIFTNVDKVPSFPGGLNAFKKFLGENLKYPTKAKANKVQGRVYLGFIVEKNGSLSELKILRGLGYGCDEEALRIVAISPKWQPGTQKGKTVRVRYALPIVFQLNAKPSSFILPPPPPIEQNPKNKSKATSLLIKKTDGTNIYGLIDNMDISTSAIEFKSTNSLIYLDGKKIFKYEMEGLNPNTVDSVNVLNAKVAYNKYGNKGKNGVIEIITKNEEQ